jgi:inner membrane protein
MTLSTALVSLGSNFLGGLFPDLDNSTAEGWEHVRGGKTIGKIIPPLLGGHRYLTHSIFGLILFGWLLDKLLMLVGHVLIVDMHIVWWSFMLGYFSHLLMDTITKEGIMWLFPIPWHIGIPPFKALRLTTGGVVEKGLVFPGLIVLNGYLIWQHYVSLIETVRLWVNKPY